MENANFNQLVSFVFGIANDCLVDVYDVGDYRKIILPMIVLRRFDAVLEPTKQAVLAMKQKLDAAGILEQDVALCSVAHEAFCNSSPFTLSDLKSRTNQQQLKQDFILYEVIRKFNEETNITDAGRHFTPRDIVELIADLAFVPIEDQIKSTTYRIYDGACGTGGMLTVAEERIQRLSQKAGKKVSIHLYGQENADETYAIARADMLVKGEGSQANNIFFGSTISNDGFPGETFDFCLSNPPFGTSWKKDLAAWGLTKKDDITDPRFQVTYRGEDFSLLPDIGDPQMLFLANNISKMKQDTPLGSRIVEVHNGSSLFTGKAGQGPSNLRQYIIKQDLLEAIVALPEKMFYNTGIGTYLWVLSNKKSAQRKGKVQLIDATTMKAPLRKNLGEKNGEVNAALRKKILDLYLAFDKADPEYSKVFENHEFGYWQVTMQQPKRDENGKILLDKKGNPVIDKERSGDTEIIPFTYEGGIDAFIQNEVHPYAPDAFVKPGSEKVGYELSFTKYFYKPVQLRTLGEIAADIRAIEKETDGLLDEIIGG